MKNKIFLGVFVVYTRLWGLPVGLEILSGDVFCEESSQKLRVYVSDGSILRWDHFSIAETEAVEFIQPDRKSVVWNLVVEEHPSRLKGRLYGEGAIFLLNPHGVFLGKEASVQAAGFVAATLEKREVGFCEQKKGLIVNQGTIQADEVFLIGYEVQNWGEITAVKVGLIGAREIDLSNGEIKMGDFSGGPQEISLGRFDGLKALDMPGPAVIHQGKILGTSVYLLGDYLDLRTSSFIKGEEVFIGGGEAHLKNSRIVKLNGMIEAERIQACSDGALQGQGQIKGRLEVSSPLLLDLP